MGRTHFQLPTLLICKAAPRAMSFNREWPRHMTMSPGRGSLARARSPPNLEILMK